MARDWDQFEAEIRDKIERKLADAHQRAERRAQRIRERAERHAERAARRAEWVGEMAKARAEDQARKMREQAERGAGRAESIWNTSSVAGLRINLSGCNKSGKSHNESEIAFGIFILVAGAALLLSNLGLVHDVGRMWPLALVAFGIIRLTRAKFPSATGFAIFLIATGAILTFSNFGIIHASWNLFWPAILIMVGLQHLLSNFDPPEVKEQRKREKAEHEAQKAGRSATASDVPPPPVDPYANPSAYRYGPETPTSGPRATNQPQPPPPYAGASAAGARPGFAGSAPPPPQQPPPPPQPETRPLDPEVHVHEYCIFTGGKRRIQTNNFRGGEIVAVFGGVDIDLRNSIIGGDDAVIDITAAFGGCTLRVPESWYVEMRGVAAFGGYSNKTIPPRLSPGQRLQKLVVTGSAAFGGVVIEN